MSKQKKRNLFTYLLHNTVMYVYFTSSLHKMTVTETSNVHVISFFEFVYAAPFSIALMPVCADTYDTFFWLFVQRHKKRNRRISFPKCIYVGASSSTLMPIRADTYAKLFLKFYRNHPNYKPHLRPNSSTLRLPKSSMNHPCPILA